MKKIVSIILLLSACVSAIWASSASVVDSTGRTGRGAIFHLEGALAAGLNTFSSRGMQVDAAVALPLGKYIWAGAGLGVRHVYSLVTVGKDIHGYGEPDQRTYGDRFLLPLFARVQGTVPVGRFVWAGASFVPFARLDVGYAVDLQQSSRQRTSSGPFLIPAAGLDIRMHNTSSWAFALGVGIHASQYTEENYSTGVVTTASGNAVLINFILGRTF